ncbi:hypothetical protein COO09_21105 [Rhizorhabdus dicambivorans]|jgi:hypothetical protein|uniref:Uncharacterized protein n=3 Tax=Sphingomonadales TaxID=204457 RepID=A0A2A4FRD7_9SPHN|nr:hypothetical protein BHE75_04448 [Sphingomonas haloaromaticamans]PCE40272.1 hypothetical protein COO09_21105 [Rhizorhabdus dicambivorans]
MKRRPIMAFANYENGVHGPFTDLGQRAERMDNPLIREGAGQGRNDFALVSQEVCVRRRIALRRLRRRDW